MKSSPRAAMGGGSDFGNVFAGIAEAFSPLAGEAMYQGTGSTQAATVLHTAFSSVPQAFAGGPSGAYAGSVLGGTPGAMGAGRYSTASYLPADLAGAGAGGAGGAGPGLEGVSQYQLLETMNQNNLQLLELQSIMQNNMQQWTTKSNVMKSVHTAKMAMIQQFNVRG